MRMIIEGLTKNDPASRSAKSEGKITKDMEKTIAACGF